MRTLSTKDRERVDLAVLLFWQYRESSDAISIIWLAEQLGISASSDAMQRRRTQRRHVQDLMPYIVMAVAQAHPGWTVDRPGDGRFVMTNKPDRDISPEHRRIRQCSTKLQRSVAALGPDREGSTDPTRHRLSAQLENVNDQVAKLLGQL